VETYLAGIPAGKSWNTWTDPGIVRPAGAEKLLYKGKEAKSSVYSGRYLRAEYSEEDSAAAAVLEEYLDIRLTEEIREQLGGVYSIFAGVSLSPLPPGELSLTVFFGCDPNRSAELTQAAERELERIASEPPDAGVFAKAVEALQKSWEVSIQRNFTIAQSYANSTVIYAAPLSRLNRRTGFYAGVTPEQMQALLRRLLTAEPLRMILYPEGWTP
jgi:zinc protease